MWGSILLTLAQTTTPDRIAADEIRGAGKIAGIAFTEKELAQMQKAVSENLAAFEHLQKLPIDNALEPALTFSPLMPGITAPPPRLALHEVELPTVERPASLEDLCYADIATLASLVRSKKVRVEELVRMYVARLKRLDEKLLCVVNFTEARALAQAKVLDRELAEGRWRGPLHGLPWGAKDLLAVAGTPTTWGSKIYEHQMLAEDATVVKRLDAAGAVLIAKLSLGEIAYGDLWYRGRTRNPWKLDAGSSGSSAGAASAVAAGAVAFAIGSETLGSIVSPSAACGASSLRPTFGRVSRHGAMALSWSMDKLGPLCRTIEDTGLVLAAIAGSDGLDGTVHDAPFKAPGPTDVHGLHVGYLKGAFDASPEDQHVLEELEALHVELVPIELPHTLPVSDLLIVLTCEAATAFDEVTRNDSDEQMVWQDDDAWPNTFRAARTIPAVEYLRANRLRTRLMREMARTMQSIDVYVHPSFGSDSLLVTNLTGHPAAVAPCGFRADGTPRSITFTGQLFGEQDLVALASAWQRSTGYHRRHPAL